MVIGLRGVQFEWSTIQGVIARVRFEITSMITPWIVRHEVQLLINRIYNKFRNANVFWEVFLGENVCSAAS